MFFARIPYLKWMSLFTIIFSFIMLAINSFWTRYPGAVYLWPSLIEFLVIIFLIQYGLQIQFVHFRHSEMYKMLKLFNIYCSIVVLIMLTTSAIQYTPFKPIDRNIVQLEHLLHLDISAAMAWTHSNTTLAFIASTIYNSLGMQVFILPLLVILAREYELLYEFYFLILVSWIIGFSFYYFFPTMGPASVIDSPFFNSFQRTTGLKFWQIHHYIQPTNIEGGMIAMPSYHVIWGWLCVHLLRIWPVAFTLLLIIYLLMVISCVFLGWHYFLDVIGSAITLFISHWFYSRCKKSSKEELIAHSGAPQKRTSASS